MPFTQEDAERVHLPIGQTLTLCTVTYQPRPIMLRIWEHSRLLIACPQACAKHTHVGRRVDLHVWRYATALVFSH